MITLGAIVFMSLLPFHRKNPFFRLLLAYAAGMLVAHCGDLPDRAETGLPAALTVVIAAMAFTLAVPNRPVLKKVFGVLLMMALWVSGLIQGVMERKVQEQVEQKYLKKGIYQAVLLDQPEIRTSTVRVMARVNGEIRDDSMMTGTCKALLYIERDAVAESLEPGAGIVFQGDMRRIWQAGNPDEFDYRKYLANRRLYLQVYLPAGSYHIAETDSRKGMKVLAARTRQALLDRYRELELNSTEFGVLSALTLGYRDELDARTRNAFVHAGVMHIMAVSGFHVGVVALMLGLLLRPFSRTRMGKWARVLVNLLFLWAFAFVCGLSTSVIRATLMFSFALPGRLFGKKVNIWNMLFASTLVILSFRPGYLTDAGFQLSFLAVAGISLMQPVLLQVPKHAFFPLNSLYKILVVSFAAQLATLPVTLRYFHQFPLYFWLANLFVIPLAALVMYAGVCYLLFGFVKPIALLTGKVVTLSVKGLVLGVSWVEKLPYALQEGIDVSVAQAILLFLILLCFGLFVMHRRTGLFLAGLASLLAFLVAGTWRDSMQLRQNVLTINNLSGATCINFISGRNCLLLAHPDSLVTKAQLDYSFGSFWTHRGVYRNTIVLDPFVDEIEDREADGTERGGTAGAVGGGDAVVSTVGNPKGSIKGQSTGFTNLYIKNPFMGNNLFLQFHGRSLVVLKDALAEVPALTKVPDLGEVPVLAEVPAHAGSLDVDLLVISGTMPFEPETILRYFNFRMLVLDSSVDYYNVLRWTEWCRISKVKCWNVSEQGAFLMEDIKGS